MREYLRVVYNTFWGAPNQMGSLCHLRELVRRTQVDRGVKVFNVGDEFLMHAFKAQAFSHCWALAAQMMTSNTNLQRSGYSPNQKK